MWKLIVGAILIAAGIYGAISASGTMSKVFQGLWIAVGVYLVYSHMTTPVPVAVPGMRGGRRYRR